MPKATTITQEVIVNAAFEIVRSEGFQALSARNIANKIGCSTQPIYWVYKNMELLKKDVISKIIVFFEAEISSFRKTGDDMLDLGLGYIRVAHTDPLVFKLLYVENVMNVKLTDLIPDEVLLKTIKNHPEAIGASDEKLKEAAINAWIFAHGIASLVASGMMPYDELKIERILLSMFD